MSDRGRVLLAITGMDLDAWKEAFTSHSPDRQVVSTIDPAEAASIRYAVAWKPEPGSLEGFPQLRAIFSAGAGVDHLLGYPGLPDVPIVRVVSPDLTQRMSEYVAWQALDHLRRGALYRRQQRDHIWDEPPGQPAAGEVTVAIMGLGVLGTDAALKLKGLGFRVTGWSRRPKDVDGVVTYHGEDGLTAVLADADILVVLLPLTEATRGVLAGDLFRRMKRSGPLGAPILINAGRGGLQNEDDILTALDAGVLGAASLDVFNREPLPADHPLWEHPRVTITPHAAAASMPSALVPQMVRQMEAIEAGKPVENLVDRSSQY